MDSTGKGCRERILAMRESDELPFEPQQAARPEISVVLPVYNEALNIRRLLVEVRGVMDEIGRSYEIIAVDDGSDDGTADLLAEVDYVRTITSPYNKGNGATVKTGIRHARGRLIILMDGDGQHDPKSIPSLLEKTADYELVIGARTDGKAQALHRRLANLVYNRLASYVSGHKVEDLTSGFRISHRDKIARFIPLFPNGFSYPATSTLAFLRSGFSVAFVPVSMRRREGKSKISLSRDGIRFVLIVIKTISLFNPLRIFLPASAVCIAFGIGHAAFKIFIQATRYTNLSILFVSTGVLIFFIGLVSEQIAMLRFERTEQD
jgi:glycosyltransferase involved in cell wall biosynthesis